MYVYEVKDQVYVCALEGGGHADDDFKTHVDNLRAAAATGPLHVVVMLRAGHPVPSSFWRSQVRDLMTDPSFRARLFVVTTNPMIRGVLTALSWFLDEERVTIKLRAAWPAARELLERSEVNMTLVDELVERVGREKAA